MKNYTLKVDTTIETELPKKNYNSHINPRVSIMTTDKIFINIVNGGMGGSL